jgi:hypothetical protein
VLDAKGKEYKREDMRQIKHGLENGMTASCPTSSLAARSGPTEPLAQFLDHLPESYPGGHRFDSIQGHRGRRRLDSKLAYEKIEGVLLMTRKKPMHVVI